MKANLYKNSVIGMVITVVSVFSNCKKGEDHQPFPYTPLSDFFARNGAKEQVFFLDGNSGGTLTGVRETKIIFPPNAFVQSGGAPYEGSVKIKLREIYSKADMILSGAPTMSGVFPLESGGEIFISAATMFGTKLNLKPKVTYTAELPAGANILGGMRLFYGNEVIVNADKPCPPNDPCVNDRTDKGTKMVDWTADPDTIGKKVTYNVSPPLKYILSCDSLNWTNCDRFFYGPYIKITVKTDGAPDLINTAVYVSFTGKKTVWSLYDNVNNNFFSDHVAPVPVTIVGICSSNGKVYSAFKEMTLADGDVIPLSFTQTDEEKLINKLNLLK